LNEVGLLSLIKRMIREGCEVVLFCFEPESDERYYRELLSRLSDLERKAISVHNPESLDDSIRELGHMDLVVGMRLHACVFSAALGIPFLSIPYDPKVQMFTEEIGLQNNTCSLEEVGPLCWDQLIAVEREYYQHQADIDSKYEDLRARAASNFKGLSEVKGDRVTFGCRLKGAFYSIFLLAIGFVSVFRGLFSSSLRRFMANE
jgi:polysaccharide pyruvyl transferase WcaK-like protein